MSMEKIMSIELNEKPKNQWGKRHTFALLSFLGLANVYSMKMNLSVAIVAMVKHQSQNLSSTNDVITSMPGTTFPDVTTTPTTSVPEDFCPLPAKIELTKDNGPFEWNEEIQGTVLGAFFYGYIFTQIPGGILSEKFGGKWIFGAGILVAGISALLAPLASIFGIEYFIAMRVLVGFCMGSAFPSLVNMLALWIPSSERSTLGAFVYAGAQAGTFLAYPLCGWLADTFGWESVFYVTGGLACLWFVFWALLIAESPATHSTIGAEEKAFLDHHIECKMTDDMPLPPLKAIFMTPAFLALIVAHCGQNWGLLTLLTEAPSYLNNVLHFSLTENGILSGLPWLSMSLFSIIYGRLTDYMIVKNYITMTTGRKIGNTVGFIGPAIGLVGLCFIGCSKPLAVLCLCIAVGLNGATYSGWQVNHMDLSPNFAGTLMGITNTIANIFGCLAPMFVGKMTNNNQTIGAWQIVFMVTAGIYVVTNAIFVFFATAETQSWNEIKVESKPTNKSCNSMNNPV